MNEDWIDRHSVTCVLCGGLADERRTVDIQPDELVGADYAEKPEYARLVEEIADTLGTGEAHQECFEYVQVNNLDPSGADLEPRDHQ